ncbi:MAG: hypothetical protein JNK90_12010 [Planctomycetaceae bacterium]|nr:hypothetical protein [Planctomycetaceae bacterium]
MSYYSNSYQPTPPPSKPKSSRSIILFLLVLIASFALLVITPIARYFVIRMCNEFDVDVGDISKVILLFYPEFMAFGVIFVVALLEFAVPSGFVKNILNGIALAFVAFLAFVIAVGMVLPMIRIMNEMN